MNAARSWSKWKNVQFSNSYYNNTYVFTTSWASSRCAATKFTGNSLSNITPRSFMCSSLSNCIGLHPLLWIRWKTTCHGTKWGLQVIFWLQEQFTVSVRIGARYIVPVNPVSVCLQILNPFNISGKFNGKWVGSSMAGFTPEVKNCHRITWPF